MLYYPHLKGQGFVEYALVMLLVALVVIIVLSLLGPQIGTMYSSVISSL
jgi:pilus assembly protein Flp/PilA